MSVITTRWRWLIRRSRLEQYLRNQAEALDEQGAEQGAFVLRQLAENLRMGMSLGVEDR